MFRKMLNIFTRMLGWNAIGKRVCLISGEGPDSAILSGASGLIKDVCAGQFGQEVIRLELDRGIIIHEARLTDIFLVPRHRDYGSIALATTCIAVYVVDKFGVANESIANEDSILALMDMCVTSSRLEKTRSAD